MLSPRRTQSAALAVAVAALLAACTDRVPVVQDPAYVPSDAEMADFAAKPAGQPFEAREEVTLGGRLMNLVAPPAGYVDAVVNGGFESGFAGWTRNVIGFGYNGDPATGWLVGANDPNSYAGGMPHTESLAHSGVNGASAIEQGSTLHTLYQDVTIANDGSTLPVVLHFWLRWKNQSGAWNRGDPSCGNPFGCQDVSVNIRNPSTNAIIQEAWSAFTTGAPLFSGGGNFTTANYQGFVINLGSVYKGQTIRLQFENRVCCFFQYLDIDDVQVMVPVNQPPVANAGGNRTVEATSPVGANVTLDGSASSDPDGQPLTYTWSGPFGTVSGVTANVPLGFGANNVSLTVTDPFGATSTDNIVITIVDTTAPTIAANVSTNTVWPPNHKMVTVITGIQASDVGDPNPTVNVVVTSNEPEDGLGDGDTAPDWKVVGGSVQVRAERSGTGQGRTYLVLVQATDAFGNASSVTYSITVPKSQK